MKKRTLYGHDRVKYEDKDVEGMLEPLAPGERLDVLRTYRDELQQALNEIHDMEQGRQQATSNQADSTPTKHASQGGGSGG